jgi:hypothetical protein
MKLVSLTVTSVVTIISARACDSSSSATPNPAAPFMGGVCADAQSAGVTLPAGTFTCPTTTSIQGDDSP